MRNAVTALNQNQLILFPCDTVWGVLGSFTAASAEAIVALKQRDPNQGFVTLISSLEALETVCAPLTAQQTDWIASHWPNPLTLVLPKRSDVPDVITGGRETIAVRLPDFGPLNDLLTAFGKPILSSSANPSGAPLPQRFSEIDTTILSGVSNITDAPQPGMGVASTLVDLTGEAPIVLRDGSYRIPS